MVACLRGQAAARVRSLVGRHCCPHVSDDMARLYAFKYEVKTCLLLLAGPSSIYSYTQYIHFVILNFLLVKLTWDVG